MVSDAFKAEELPEDFAMKVLELLDIAAESKGRHAGAAGKLRPCLVTRLKQWALKVAPRLFDV